MTRRPGPVDPRGKLGLDGEGFAEQALRRAGMRILERRFRLRCGEIDLIAEHSGTVVFVEVKTRSGTGYGRPAESVTARKRARMARVASAFLQRRRWLDRPARFDVVEVFASPHAAPHVRHIADAFRLWPTG